MNKRTLKFKSLIGKSLPHEFPRRDFIKIAEDFGYDVRESLHGLLLSHKRLPEKIQINDHANGKNGHIHVLGIRDFMRGLMITHPHLLEAK